MPEPVAPSFNCRLPLGTFQPYKTKLAGQGTLHLAQEGHRLGQGIFRCHDLPPQDALQGFAVPMSDEVSRPDSRMFEGVFREETASPFRLAGQSDQANGEETGDTEVGKQGLLPRPLDAGESAQQLCLPSSHVPNIGIELRRGTKPGLRVRQDTPELTYRRIGGDTLRFDEAVQAVGHRARYALDRTPRLEATTLGLQVSPY